MKKYILPIALAAFTLIGFNACEDVPAPYGINDGKTDDGGVTEGTILEETFTTSLGDFSAVNTVGTYSWAVSHSCAQVTSYVDSDEDGTKENNKAESWLISPTMNLSKVENAHISFDYILRYANSSELTTNYQILITDSYDGSPASTTWETIAFTPVQGSDWDTWYTADVNVPDAFIGKENVRVALRYKADAKAATWEVKNFKVQTGKAETPDEPSSPDDGSAKTIPYSEAFSTSLGSFVNYTTSGSGAWTIDYSTAKAAGYDNTTKITTAGTYYLVSPEISLAGQTAAHVAYDYILRYNKGDENQQLYITTSFNAEKPAEGWTLLNESHTEGRDWSTFANADINIPAEYMGKTIRLAFRYNTNETSGSTWEVKNFSIAAGSANTNTDGDDKDDNNGDTGDVDGTNGDFETWVNGVPNNWKSASTASKGSMKQSTDAHGGSYSVEVAGSTSGNNRLAYKELNLTAGDYTMTFYAKAATSAGGSVRPGYVDVVDGAANSQGYKYGSNFDKLTTTEWKKVEHTITIPADGTYCIVVMVPKNPGTNVLIDDFTLVKGSTYIIK